MAWKSRRASTPPGTDADAGLPPTDLASVVFSGVVWKAMTRGVTVATRVVVVVVLARLLTPTDYGVASMALVVTSFAMMFTDPALGAALIQRPTIDERDRSTVFWMAAGIGAVLTVLGIAASGLVADFFGEAQVEDLFIVTSACFVVVSLSVAHRALLTRRLAYRSLEIREMVSIVTGGTVAVAVAIGGFGPWAIVSNFVAYSVTSTILVWILLDWRPRASFSTESARNLAGFSTRIFAATVITGANQSLDKVLVGRFLGASALGPYSLAYSTMLLPNAVLGGALFSAVSPAFARIQHDKERLQRAWLRSKRMSIAVVSPALLALIVVAPDFVDVVFGERWDDAIIPLQLLCVGGLAHSLVTLHWGVLQARGEAGTLLRLTLMSSVVMWAAFAVGLQWGIVGVSAGYAVARWLLVVPSTWMTTRALSFDLWPALRTGADLVPAAVGATATGFVARQLLLETALPEALRLTLVSAAMFVAYGLIALVVAPSLVHEIKQVVRRRVDDGTAAR